MDVGVIIQARNGSSRLPGKVMMDLGGEPVIKRVVERVLGATKVSKVVVATTVDPVDDKMVSYLVNQHIGVVRGSVNDVLDRYYQTAKQFGFQHVVRITADCPLIDPAIIDQVIDLYQQRRVDYACNVLERTYPDGLDVEVFSFKALEQSWHDAKAQREREHVTIYIRERKDLFTHANLALTPSLGQKRWTLDYAEDFELIKNIYRELAPQDKYFGLNDILACLKRHDQWEQVNNQYVKY